MNRFELTPESEASVLRREKAMLMLGIPVGGTLTLADGRLMWKRSRWSSPGAIFEKGPTWLEVDVEKATVVSGGRRVPWTELILSLLGPISPIFALILFRFSLCLGPLNLIVLLLAGGFRKTIQIQTSSGLYHFAVKDTQPWLEEIGGVRLPGPARVRQGLRIGVLWPLLVLLALFVGFLQLLTTGGAATSPTATPTPPEATATPTPPPFVRPNPASLQQATVVKVIDGDTIDVTIDGEERRVRYYGIDAPDNGKKCFEEATARNSELLGTTVRLEPDARDQDEHGRLLRYVFNEDGLSIEAVLIGEGLAKAQREDGMYRVRFTTMETDAREADIGCLWK
jgi:micrococcal nuclease